MAESVFTVKCGTTKIDSENLRWFDENNDRTASQDELFTYKWRVDRYIPFNDKKWACFEKKVSGKYWVSSPYPRPGSIVTFEE